MITSPSNERIKHAAALNAKPRLRSEEGLFVAEGVRLFEEIPKELLSEVFYTAEGAKKLEERGTRLPDDACEVSFPVFQKMSEVVMPQGILAVVKMPEYSISDLMRDVPLIIVLEDLRDPGNLGTIFRTAEAAGATGAILTGDCADIFGPKAVRSTMGAIFRLPFVISDEIPELKDVRLYAAAMEGAVVYTEPDYTKGSAFVIGNEGKGLKKGTIDRADASVYIPMQGKTESLNASISAAILMYEAGRQRGISSLK